MSYARFSYADVYVFLSCYGELDCCGCWLQEAMPDEPTTFTTTVGMLEHLAKHAAAGHDVPTESIDALKADSAENDAWMAKVEGGMCPTCDDTRWVQNPPPGWEPCWGCNPGGKIGTRPADRPWQAEPQPDAPAPATLEAPRGP